MDFRKKSTLHSTEQDMTLQSQDVQQTPQKRSRGRPKKIVQSTSQLQGISSTSLISHLMQDSTIQHSAEQTSTTQHTSQKSQEIDYMQNFLQEQYLQQQQQPGPSTI